MLQIQTLLVPGLDGSPAGHWQDWWLRVDPRAVLVEQSDWHCPTPDAWENRLATALIRHPGSILVAHGLGCLVVVRLLRRWRKLRVRGVLLVAPSNPMLSERLCMFALETEGGRMGVPAVVANSRNDPWMDQSCARSLATSIGAGFVDLELSGHVNIASGHGPWPHRLELHASLTKPMIGPQDSELNVRVMANRRRSGA